MIKFFIKLCLVPLAVLSSTIAFASDEIKCVQRGLQDAGFDPNGIDGAIGRGTKAAALAYWVDVGINLPKLSNKSSAQWCRVFQAPAIAVKMAKICTDNDINISGRQLFAGEWFETIESDKPVFPYAFFIKEVDGNKVTGHYAHPLYDPWQHGTSCTYFSGQISDEGNLRFFTSNDGRIERVFPNIKPALLENKPVYIPKTDWKGRYGNSSGWAASVISK